MRALLALSFGVVKDVPKRISIGEFMEHLAFTKLSIGKEAVRIATGQNGTISQKHVIGRRTKTLVPQVEPH